MHFRVRGNNVQVVKTVVDKKTLKSKSVPAGSVNLNTGVLSDELLAALSEKEVHEVRRWIEGRQKMAKLRQEVEAHLLEERIYETINWMKTAPPAAADLVAESLRAMSAFRRAAIKLGLAKPEKRRPPNN